MATNFSLKFWLKSLELEQYREHFELHRITSLEQCMNLDEEKLTEIGVGATGHQRRILNHLPRDNVGEESKISASNPDLFVAFQNPLNPPLQPALPKKEKRVRDSFLFRDDQPIYGNDDVKDSMKKNGSHVNKDKLEKTPKPAPRPVPRPRKTKMKTNKDSSESVKPTPSPRKNSIPTNADASAGSISSETSIKFDIDGVCETETSTDDILELYSKPIKHIASDKLPSPCLNEDIQGQTPEFDTVYMSGDECSLNSLEERLDSGTSHSFSDTKFENAEFDPLSGAYAVKFPNISTDTKSQPNNDLKETFKNKETDHDNNSRENTEESDEESDIYEPIWGDKKEENKGDSFKHKLPTCSVRKSNLIEFSPYPKKPGFEFPSKDSSLDSTTVNKRLSMLNQSGDRDSGSFDLPPPQFPPPPLPQNKSVDESLLADFDPLATPVVPPRPNTGPTIKQFKPYENVLFPKHASSPTLPPQLNEEPDVYQGESSPVLPPRAPGIQKDPAVSHDIFENIDPFGEFKPSDPDTDFNAEMLSSPFKSPKKPELVKVDLSESNTSGSEGPVYEVAKDDVYEAATGEEVVYEAVEEEDFDPFGLKKEIVSRKTSNTSTGSNKGLNEVVPAPNWAEITGGERMYSFAGEMDESGSSGSNDDLIDDGQDGMNTVQVLPTTVCSPRKTERSGYLYKQGGVKQNRGWRKRWVIFDGKSLRYYSNQKTQVSKRVVPLSCMKKVEIDVKAGNNRQYKFLLYCENRTFLFATDTLDDCQMWSQTLMAAIINYKSPEGGEIPGGDMVDPDIADWIKFERQHSKYYVALKANKMCYYQTIDDYYMASPIHEIEMKLAAVKEIERTKLQLNTHYAFYILNFESSSDASNWKMAIEESITNALGDDTVLNQVKEANPDNATCADCKAKDAHWASMNLGIVLCLKCAGIHRGFELRLSKVRSLRMDCKIWNSSLLEMFRVIGNKNSNQFWSWNMPQGSQIDENTPLDVRKEHIHNKYKNKLYCDLDPLSTNKEDLNEALLSAAQTDEVLLTLKILFSGADVLYHRPGEPDTTAFELAKAAHQRIQMEFLLQNGGDKTQNFTPGTEEENQGQGRRVQSQNIKALVAKLRGEIQHQGYLQKTGPNMKGHQTSAHFLKRWCVLEHGHLSYYLNEESKVEKDRIENDTIQCLQAVSHDKNPSCMEISCSKKNGSHRVFLFAASSHEDRLQWMRKISQVFCPVSLMDHVKDKEMALAGYVFIKFGFNLEWQKSWVLLENRTLYYTDKNNTEGTCDSVDLRKVTSLVKITTTTSACATCLESGPQFVLHVPEKALYFQADLVKDTERMFGILQTAAKQGGDTLEDQLLNTNNVPIIIHSCIDFIEANGMRLKGIYREAAQNSKVQAILDKFKEDARSVVLKMEEHTVHEVCNALKRFLRNMSDPLLTAKLYSQWIGTAGKFTGKSHTYNMLEWYRYLLHQLPRTNYLTLKCIAAHLWKLSKHSSENLMTLDNISIAFGSTLMKSATAEGSATVAEVNAGRIGNNMQLEMKVISDIVTHYEDLFDVNEAEARQKRIEDEIRKAEEKMKGARVSVIPNNEIMVEVYNLDPTGSSDMVKISTETTVNDVINSLMDKRKKGSSSSRDSWVLHEIVRKELERPLHGSMKLWPLIHEWQNWSREYSAESCLCLKSNELAKGIERAYDPSKALFGELKYADKKKFGKMTFEFTQSRLSLYKDSKNLNSPTGSWNIEDLSIYKGSDSRRPHSPSTKWTFTFLKKGEPVNKSKSDLPYFGRTVCCSSENELLSWLAGMLITQNGGKWS